MITTHVLDTSQGRPVSGVPVTLEMRDGSSWRAVGQGATDADGRLRAGAAPQPGLYRLRFETRSRSAFFPEVSIVFEVSDSKADYHVPLLISPFGYSTYRGS
ncbi:MAG: hydroxyisourate hydrolase [Deltaproteobacteria bacterium]|nr:MAG: hydroxyisourate hydrolase [Deltaproteobacteria bacterium]